MSAGLVAISCPTRSAQGPQGAGFYGRFPQGNAPAGAQLDAAANDATSATGVLSSIPLHGAANDTTAALGNLGSGTDSLEIVFPQNTPLGVGLQAVLTMAYIGSSADVASFSIISGLFGDMTATPVADTQTGNFVWTPSAADVTNNGSGNFSVGFEFTDTNGNFGTGSITFVVS